MFYDIDERLKCVVQTIKDHSNIDKPCPVTETKSLSKHGDAMWRQIVESNFYSDNSRIYLGPEISSDTNCRVRSRIVKRSQREKISLVNRSFEVVSWYLFTNNLVQVIKLCSLYDMRFIYFKAEVKNCTCQKQIYFFNLEINLENIILKETINV
jgi:hypothetical protein